MFHSSSSRHEQYLVRPSHSKATLSKKRSSLESEISGADSGYTSSSSTPSSGSPISPTHHVTKKNINFNEPNDDYTTTASTASIITKNSIEPIKKKKSKKHQPPRQPDLVYSCPRPLAFPFHNDDHFLPIAEADPRDVARVSPSLNRSSSLQSSKTSVGSTRMYDNYQYSTSHKAVDTESSYSQQSSILSTIQRGTVRSIRSLFQLPDSLSNKGGLSRVQTNNTSHTSYSSSTRHTSDTHTNSSPNQSNPQLERLEIKKGTVQSIKDMFSKKRASFQTQPVAQQTSRQQKGYVGATIGQFESSTSNSNYSRANISAAASASPKKKVQPLATFKPVACNVTKPEQTRSKGSFTSRATEFASRTIWKPKANPDLTPATKPLPKNPSQKTLKSEVKKLSARMFALPKTWRSNDEGNVSLPVTANEASAKPKRSLFSFKRSDISDSAANKKSFTASESAADVPPPPATTVRKMWKSFKSLVTGKKSSRVGVL
ncbi:hypothetical protein BDF21DRAFT_428103 [Thamnidium elegans]|uniref:Uncharacterized protein n=1 Tax=Thamnidium elegans TaxID=101142 RepID=A0A8H7SSF1_9FUNG|nr:hypothetical protein INT48_007744 [Thamnidium elegans]KAI8064056.1 hypothetical protein BDF21DRAFT_428103 [Thamnidium elegans]